MATIAVITFNGTRYEIEDTQARADVATKQPLLTFDLTPLVNSQNPVTSDGIARAIADFITANVSNLVNYYTKTEIDGKLSPVYKPAGGCASVAALGSLTSEHEGFVYDMTAEFTTTSDFKDYASQGAKTFPAGTQVAIVNVGTTQSPTYKYDTLSGFVDLSPYATKEEIADTPEFVEEELAPELEDEFERLLRELYQALTDASIKIANAQQAATNANQKAALAEEAAINANNKASLANVAATNAQNKANTANEAAVNANAKAQEAYDAAQYANERGQVAEGKGNVAEMKGNYAKQQGDYAKTKADEIEDARGTYATLNGRLNAMTQATSDVTSEVEQARGGYGNLNLRLNHIESELSNVVFVEDNTDGFDS